MTNPYLIHGPAMISFSGGRTSAYMLKMILDAHGGTLPDDVHVCFANTGKEREETLRFVHDCATHWGVNVRWLEWRTRDVSVPLTDRFEEVGYNSASRDGEPFAGLIAAKSYTPNAVTRFCTSELKVRVIKHFMQSLGYKNWQNVVGLRHDEQHRVARSRKPNKEAWSNCLPLDDAKVSNRDVRAFWREQPFDLQLLPFEGNCDGCFLKARPKLWEIERTRPGTLDWWARMEIVVKGRFVTEYSYDELKRDVRNQPDMFAGGLFDNDPEMDAECGTWCGEAA
ncbi:phosphoadenosine phosphosulfate reductase family protein [Sphingobium sp.]|uniref:phosphoadenosine phosphosulfate reductase domain-containing protein n=1 Tax=Sphingobium sp. TaxID=1912891 RepID=UPI00257BF562|nr:phosphoadenosine phosphosulfate reductase family protein [Sphingobium sp.]